MRVKRGTKGFYVTEKNGVKTWHVNKMSLLLSMLSPRSMGPTVWPDQTVPKLDPDDHGETLTNLGININVKGMPLHVVSTMRDDPHCTMFVCRDENGRWTLEVQGERQKAKTGIPVGLAIDYILWMVSEREDAKGNKIMTTFWRPDIQRGVYV